MKMTFTGTDCLINGIKVGTISVIDGYSFLDQGLRSLCNPIHAKRVRNTNQIKAELSTYWGSFSKVDKIRKLVEAKRDSCNRVIYSALK